VVTPLERPEPIVLVLDDDPLVREAAVRHLQKSGYVTVEAASMDAALEILCTTTVIAAVLDMRLPEGRTGLELLMDLRRVPEFREIPVLIVTGAALSPDEVAIAKHRAYVFFKPEGMGTIVSFLDRLTGRDLNH
jgi:CheY-like chemotaxis protein